jgi:hypothetical protein
LSKPVKIEAVNIFEAIDDMKKKFKEDFEKYKKNGKMCLKCGKNPGDTESLVDQFQCKECNKEVEELIKKLQNEPGFCYARIPTD